MRGPGASTPVLMRGAGAVIAVLTLALSVLLGLEVRHQNHGLAVIGGQAAPEVSAASDLYFALNDMDAQVANVLLVGGAKNLGFTRAQALTIYGQRRQQANRDVQTAGAVTTDPDLQRLVGVVLDGLGRYEAQVARTLLLQEQGDQRAGHASGSALVSYRQGYQLLRTELLPAAQQLTDRNARSLESVYAAQHHQIAVVRAGLIGTGILLLAVLIALQGEYARRFRRLVSPLLVLATVLVGTGLIAGVALLTHQAGLLQVAKKDAFDSILALSQARSISYDANADESRYLLDPGRAAQYEQSFFVKTQQVVGLQVTSISSWDSALSRAISGYRVNHDSIGWGGLMGAEFRNITFPGERAAAEKTLPAYQIYQQDDRRIRALVTAGRVNEAIAFCTSYAPGQSNYAFTQYDDALAALILINQKAFQSAVSSGEDQLRSWPLGLAAGGLAVVVLIIAAGRPRLREYQ